MSSTTDNSSPRSFPEMAATLGALLRAPYRRLQRELYAGLERKFPEVRRAHSVVFRHLAPDGSRLTDLAENAEMTKQSMAYLVGHLAEAGYVKTSRHPDDGRAILVRLTARGRAFVDAAVKASAGLEQQAAERMGAADIARLRDLLARLDAAFSEVVEKNRDLGSHDFSTASSALTRPTVRDPVVDPTWPVSGPPLQPRRSGHLP